MSTGKLLINLILMKTFAELSVIPTKDDLFSDNVVTQGSLQSYFDFIITKYPELSEKKDYDIARQLVCDTMDELCDLSGEYNVKVGNSLSYGNFIKLEANDKKTYDLFHPEVKPGAFNEIEGQFSSNAKKLMNYFKENKEAELHPFAASETGIAAKQLNQFIGFVGLKPAMDGSVIPVTITDNFFKGLTGLESYYINSCGTRKALATNNKMTKRSGYLTRKLSLSNIDHYHDNNIKDCGTKYFIVFSVDNQRKLNQIIGRHYYDLDENNNKISDLKTVSMFSTDLIGKKIGLRSPVTCASKCVCATCYGRELSEINKNINTGLSATLKLTEPLTQRLLSAKHRATCC